MEWQFQLVALTLVQLGLLFAVMVALYDLVQRALRSDSLLAFSAAVALLGVLGYLAFWVAFASYPVFRVLKIVLLALLVVRFAIVVHRRRLTAHIEQIGEPLVFVFLFCVVVLALGFAGGGIDDPAGTAQTRFGHSLPPDNILPLIIAEQLRDGVIHSSMLASWLSSDRPPLQTGLYLLFALQQRALGYQVVATWLQATFLFGVWGLCVAAGLPVAARRLTMLACCLLPPVILNTFFTWPKLLSVSYLLLCFALLFRRAPPDELRIASGVLIGSLAALAMLSHGTAAFALIGFAIAVVVFWAWPPLKAMIAGAAAMLALYVPWMLYQTFIDPPGNRLLKWHLAGVIDVDPRPFGQTLRESYGALSWHDYIAGRIENLGGLIGTWPSNLMEIARLAVSRDPDVAPAVRIADFFQFLPSLHVFSIALIIALVLLPFMRGKDRQQRDFALRMLVALVATALAFAVLIFTPGMTANHHGTYAMHAMATALAFIVLSLRAPRLALGLAALQLVTVGTAYVVMLPQAFSTWLVTPVFVIASIALLVYGVAPSLRGGAITR